MKDYIKIVKTMIEPLVEDASSVDVKILPSADENELKILIIAHEQQIPRLIGKQGRNANAVRQLVRAAAIGEKKKVIIDFEAF